MKGHSPLHGSCTQHFYKTRPFSFGNANAEDSCADLHNGHMKGPGPPLSKFFFSSTCPAARALLMSPNLQTIIRAADDRELLARPKHPLIKYPLRFLWRFEDLYKSWALSLHFASVISTTTIPCSSNCFTKLYCLKPVVSVCSTSSLNTFWLERTKTTAFQVGILLERLLDQGGVFIARSQQEMSSFAPLQRISRLWRSMQSKSDSQHTRHTQNSSWTMKRG